MVFFAPCLLGGGAARAAAAANAEPVEARFDVLELQIDGNTVLATETIERAVMPFLGPQKTLHDVETARAALEQAYQSAGYLTVFVDVPEQRVAEGVVRLVVTEGKVDVLAVTGSRYFSQGFIRNKVPELAEGKVPNFNVVQQELAQLNRSEDRQVRPVLRPGAAPGTVEAELQVSDKLPLSGAVELNNDHSPNTHELRLSGSLRYDNLFQRDHSLALTLITAPQAPRESEVLAANYLVPLAEDASLLASLTVSNSTVEPLGAATVVGKGTTFGLRYLQGIGNRPNESHSLSVGADYKDVKQRVQTGADNIDTPVRYLPFSLAYSGTINGDTGSQTLINASWVATLRNLLSRTVECPGNVGPVDQFACTREGADGGFSILRADLRYTTPWSLGGSMALRVGGQLTSDPLVSGEQYFAGGSGSVRGYLEGEATGDIGTLGSFEWRSNNLRDWLAAKAAGPGMGTSDGGSDASVAITNAKAAIDEFTLFGFLDAARLQTLQPSAGQAGHVYLAGTGVGLRLRGWKKLSTELQVGWPMKLTADTPSHGPRVHFKLGLAL